MKNLSFNAFIFGTRKHFQIIARSWETRSSWGHESDLFVNTRFSGSHKCRYYNRTWEAWTYQTCMQALLREYVEKLNQERREEYKQTNHLTRIDKQTAAKMDREAENLKNRLFAHLEKANKNAW